MLGHAALRVLLSAWLANACYRTACAGGSAAGLQKLTFLLPAADHEPEQHSQPNNGRSGTAQTEV